ncbi:hypothetical protein HZA56_03450 [Candidatus Poribacteria bacterium]|nr:hypothetical protein [Candidatus Poribacteria bacterium]
MRMTNRVAIHMRAFAARGSGGVWLTHKAGARGAAVMAACAVSVALIIGLAWSAPVADAAETSAVNRAYKVLAWNDLGMHCYNADFRELGVLPPYNNLWAQVVRVGNPPQIVTSGIIVKYQIVRNTSSVTKTNFWTYAQSLFNLAEPLPPDIGLTGKGLSGTMDLAGDHFVAEGIPVTEYRDGATRPDPYQLAYVSVWNATTMQLLAHNLAVVPVSSEMHCDTCHNDVGDATTAYPIKPTGKVETNILTLHDYLNQGKYQPSLMNSRPVLCANCHASNALGMPGAVGVSNLSHAMHNHHQNLPDITPDTEGCYNCHPGPVTKCLRCVMTQKYGFNCTTCHGDMALVAGNPDPWLHEPRCDAAHCHGGQVALNQPLYRKSTGHNGIYCAGCHDSPHAIAPSRERKDAYKFMILQGEPGTLEKCTVCHATEPAGDFRHLP